MRRTLPTLLVAVLTVLAFAPTSKAQTPPGPEPTEPTLAEAPFIRLSPAPDRLLVNLPVWLAIRPDAWRAVEVTIQPPPTPDGQVPAAVRVRAMPEYVIWDMGNGASVRCDGPGTIYNRRLPLEGQRATCSYTYEQLPEQRRPTVRARIFYRVEATTEVDGQSSTQELPPVSATDEIDVVVSEVQGLDPGVTIDEAFPAGGAGGAAGTGYFQPEAPPGDTDELVTEGPLLSEPPGLLDRLRNAATAVGNCFNGWGATCTRWAGVGLAAVGTGAVCVLTVGVGCVAAAVVVGSIAQGALFCDGGSTLGCALKGGAIGLATLLVGGLVGRIALRAFAPLLARVGPAVTRLIPVGLRHATAAAAGWLARVFGRPIAALAAASRRRVLALLGRVAGRLPGRVGQAASRGVAQLWVRHDARLGLGGAYGGIRNRVAGGQVNHMPAFNSYARVYNGPLSQGQLRYRGPSIWMDDADHALTRSFDWKPGADAWRRQQEALIRDGRLRDAIQMDIDDIRSQFGPKYDVAIDEMMRYVDSGEFQNVLSPQVPAAP